jgi:hypothetical protein
MMAFDIANTSEDVISRCVSSLDSGTVLVRVVSIGIEIVGAISRDNLTGSSTEESDQAQPGIVPTAPTIP